MVRIGFDETHDEAAHLSEQGPNGLSRIRDWLVAEGHEVQSITENFITNLSEHEVLVLTLPRRDFPSGEQTALVAYIREGGRVFILAEWGNIYEHADHLNQITSEFEIQFAKDRITDHQAAMEQNIVFMGNVIETRKIPQFVRVNLFRDHPITEGLNEIVYFAGCSMRAPGSQVLAWSSPSAFGDLDANQELDPGERTGSLPILTYYEGRGRLVCLGDSNIVTNGYLDHADNLLLIQNILSWLIEPVGEEE